jgi:hypothetical protein
MLNCSAGETSDSGRERRKLLKIGDTAGSPGFNCGNLLSRERLPLPARVVMSSA